MGFACLSLSVFHKFNLPVDKYRGKLVVGKFPLYARRTGTVTVNNARSGFLPAMASMSEIVETEGDRPTANYHGNLWSDEFIQSLESPYADPVYQERANLLVAKIKFMFSTLEDGEISPSAYDTAWVARVPASARDSESELHPQFPQAVAWLIKNQLEDGSWGLQSAFSICDRLLCTLNSVIALTIWKTGNLNCKQGVHFITENIRLLVEEEKNNLSSDFEIIFPALLQTAKSLHLSLPYDLPFLQLLMDKHEALLSDISSGDHVLHSIPKQMLHALEGLEKITDWQKIMSLQSGDGSFLSSPASTACVFIHTGDKRCYSYLNNLVDKFGGCVPCLYPIDLLERLWLVDNIERLGIDRYFTQEIKVALDYVYRHWNERGIGWSRYNLLGDLNTTSIGLRVLRLHGYNVSSEVLKNFKDENGLFFSCAFQTHIELRSIVNLFRASEIAFPDEEIMDEAKIFAYNYLRNVQATTNISNNRKLSNEIEYMLEYRWHESMPRLETRSYIYSYDPSYIWHRKTSYKMQNLCNIYCLDLAKLDFNILQSVFQSELKLISSWWKESGMANINFTRHRHVETFSALAEFEPQYSLCRISCTKIVCIQVVFDDICDVYGTLDEMKILVNALKRWDTSLINDLPHYMKDIFRIWYETMEEINAEVLQQQGPAHLNRIRKDWEMYLDSYVQEKEWDTAKYLPSMEEYLKNSCISMGLGPASLQPILVMGEHVTDTALQRMHYPSKFLHDLNLCTRLKDDIGTFKGERSLGHEITSITSYIKDNPRSTEKEAINHISAMNDNTLKEFNLEYCKLGNDVPTCCKRFIFNLRIGTQLFFKNMSGFNNSSGSKLKSYVKKILIEPVEL